MTYDVRMAASVEFTVTLRVESETKCVEIQRRLASLFDEWTEEGLVESDATTYTLQGIPAV